MKPLPAFYNELRGQTFVHCDTSEEYTRGLSTSTRPDLVVPTADTVLTDGRTDSEKKVRFQKKCPLVRTGPNWTDISVLWTLFSVLSDAVRTALGTKKARLKFEGKKGLCTNFACLHCLGKSSQEYLSPKLSNAPACPQLSVETYPHACKMKEQSAPKNQSKEDRNRGIKHKREPMLWKSFLLRFQSSKTKITPATMSFKLAMWRIS